MGKLVVVTGPSGCGKTTLIKRYLSENENARFSVSHTTRKIREGETDGVDYHFVTESDFSEMIANGEFLEWANVHTSKYGTAFNEVSSAKDGDMNIILDIDVQGAMTLQDKSESALYVFIKPPSIDALKERLEGRNTEDSETLKVRIWNAKRELQYTDKFDIVITNDDLEETYQEFNKALGEYINKI